MNSGQNKNNLITTSLHPERQSRNTVFSLLFFLLLFGPLSIWWAKSYAVYVSIIPVTMAVLCAAIGWWRAYLVRKEGEEAQERERLQRTYQREDLFEDQDDAMRLAEQTRRQFDQWAIPGLTVIMGLALGLGAWFVQVYLAGLMSAEQKAATLERLASRNPVESLGFALCAMLISVLLGVYWNGVSRERGCRFIRPAGQWILFAGLIYAVILMLMLVEVAVQKNPELIQIELDRVRMWDIVFGRLVCYLMLAFAVQMLGNWVVEFYRPRRRGEEARPLYESRLMSLFTEPGGIARNVAYTLNYQFGFKVSETWFTHFFEFGILSFLYGAVILLYLFDCVILVQVDEQGIVTRLGRIQRVIAPGFHLKLPWPLARAHIEKVRKIQTLNIGYVDKFDKNGKLKFNEEEAGGEEAQGDPTGRILVWGKHHHTSETKYLMPAALIGETGNVSAAGNEASTLPSPEKSDKLPAIDLVSINVLCGYRIRYDEDGTGLKHFLFNYCDTRALLRFYIQRELIALLSSSSMLNLMTTENQSFQNTLEKRITNRLELLRQDPATDLGVEVLYVVVTGIHPPVSVAKAFQNVVTARQERDETVHKAWSEYHKIMGEAESRQAQLLAEAESYRFEKITVPEMEIRQYQARLANFTIAPEVFKMRTYMDALEEILSDQGITKYIVLSPSSKRLTEVFYKEKVPDIQDLNTEKRDQ